LRTLKFSGTSLIIIGNSLSSIVVNKGLLLLENILLDLLKFSLSNVGLSLLLSFSFTLGLLYLFLCRNDMIYFSFYNYPF
jgi:hypothetical protein